MRIMVIGAFTSNPEYNMRRMNWISGVLSELGHMVYAPAMLGWTWEKTYGVPVAAQGQDYYDFWMEWSSHFMDIADAVFRIEGKSSGADIEEAIARERGLTIYTDVRDVPSAR